MQHYVLDTYLKFIEPINELSTQRGKMLQEEILC